MEACTRLNVVMSELPVRQEQQWFYFDGSAPPLKGLEFALSPVWHKRVVRADHAQATLVMLTAFKRLLLMLLMIVKEVVIHGLVVVHQNEGVAPDRL